MIPKEKKRPGQAFALVLSDVLFVFLPLMVIGIILSFKGGFWHIFSEAEWSFAAAVLSGQIITKLVSGLLASKETADPSLAIFWISAVIVFLLVPSLIVLSLMLTVDVPSFGLIIAQIVLLILALLVYILFGTFAYYVSD